jgi:hypothetical protein
MPLEDFNVAATNMLPAHTPKCEPQELITRIEDHEGKADPIEHDMRFMLPTHLSSFMLPTYLYSFMLDWITVLKLAILIHSDLYMNFSIEVVDVETHFTKTSTTFCLMTPIRSMDKC